MPRTTQTPITWFGQVDPDDIPLEPEPSPVLHRSVKFDFSCYGCRLRFTQGQLEQTFEFESLKCWICHTPITLLDADYDVAIAGDGGVISNF